MRFWTTPGQAEWALVANKLLKACLGLALCAGLGALLAYEEPETEPLEAEFLELKQLSPNNKQILAKYVQQIDATWSGANAKVIAPKPAPKPPPTPKGDTMTVEATYYTAGCKGCSGITYTGVDVRDTIYNSAGERIIAVDPNVIPLGSKVLIEGTTYRASDIGSAIKGKRIDILVSSKKEAKRNGRHDITIKVLSSEKE